MKKAAAFLLTVFIFLFCIPLFVFSITADELYSSMLENNPNVKKAGKEVSRALLDIKDAKAGRSPTIDLTVTGSYIANPMKPISINIGDYIDTTLYGVKNDYIRLYKGQESSYYKFSLSVTQPIFTWGKISNAVKLHQQVYDVRLLQLEDSIDKAGIELYTRIAALHYLLEIDRILSSQQEIAQRLVELAEKALENGMMLETEALSVRVQARQLDVAKARTEQQITIMLTEIGNITGQRDFEASDLEFNEEAFGSLVSKLSSSDSDTILANALSDSRTTFKLLSVLADIAVLAKDIAAASVNWKPDFAFVVNADYSGSRLPLMETDWYGKDDWNATLSIALKTTVFDGGKASRDVKRAESSVSEANIDIESAKLQVRSAVSRNLTDLSVALAGISYQQALSLQLDAQSRVDKSLLDTGYGSESDYLKGRLERNNCEIEILKAKTDLAAAVYTLLYLEGEIASADADFT